MQAGAIRFPAGAPPSHRVCPGLRSCTGDVVYPSVAAASPADSKLRPSVSGYRSGGGAGASIVLHLDCVGAGARGDGGRVGGRTCGGWG